MALTSALVARVHRRVEDPGPDPELVYHSDDDYARVVESILSVRPDRNSFWLFASGSLIWKPEVEHLEGRVATVRGYHRSFCLKLTRWRGSVEQPGLMMALDRGGQCRGVVFRLDHGSMEEQLHKLVRREMRTRPPNNNARWLTARTADGPVAALAFVMNRNGPGYVGRQPLEATVEMLARACGHAGSCAEYLHNTVAHLERLGIHDRHLWELQELVAARIAADNGVGIQSGLRSG